MRCAAFVLAALGAMGLGGAAQGHPDPLPDALAAGWQNEKVCELLHGSETHRVLLCTFPPGFGHERHFHPAHFGYALSGGRMQLTSAQGTRVAEIAEGSHFASGGVEWHEVVNIGDSTVAYLIIEEL